MLAESWSNFQFGYLAFAFFVSSALANYLETRNNDSRRTRAAKIWFGGTILVAMLIGAPFVYPTDQKNTLPAVSERVFENQAVEEMSAENSDHPELSK